MTGAGVFLGLAFLVALASLSAGTLSAYGFFWPCVWIRPLLLASSSAQQEISHNLVSHLQRTTHFLAQVQQFLFVYVHPQPSLPRQASTTKIEAIFVIKWQL